MTSHATQHRAGRSLSLPLAIALIAATTAPAVAQVNTENLRKRIKSTGYSLILEGSVTANTGNTVGIAAGGGTGGGWGRDRHLLFAYARADYARYNGTTSADKTFAHIRYNLEFAPWLWGEVFAQAQSDAFQRLTLRNLLGTGPRFRLLHDPAEGFDVYVGTAYMFERDVIFVAPGARDKALRVWHRWSTYLTVQWEIDARAIMATTMYVQPVLSDFANVRLLDETLLTFKVTKFFAAGISCVVRYDSRPPTAVKTTDVELKNSLSLIF